MTRKEYNGWFNYETWIVNLWIGNDEGLYSYWQEEAIRVFEEAEGEGSISKSDRAWMDLADRLKDFFEENQPEECKGANVYADLMGAALSEVNWEEIAQHMIADLDLEEA